jgi:IS4 transposase
MLVLADRGFFSFSLWTKASASGADLLWRTKSSHSLPLRQRLSDGSFLSVIYPSLKDRRHDTNAVTLRVVEYALGGEGADDTTYRLLTTILDPTVASAAQLARLYAERWEIESAFDELKTHQRSARVVLRSKMPEGVLQEVYGYFCVHYAIRWLMHSVALGADADPDRISFTRTLRVARRTTASHPGFSPSGT